MINAGASAGILLAAGCAGTKAADQSKRAQAAPTVKTESFRAPKVVLIDQRRDLLRLSVVAEGADADERELAADIVKRTQGALAADDAKIVIDGKCDVRVTIRPKLATVDRDGDYIRLNCEADVEMKSPDGKRLFGAKKIEIRSQQRTLGKAAAISKLSAAAAKETADWCRSELKRIANAEIGVSLLTIQLPAEEKTRNTAAGTKAIGSRIARLPNLVACEFVGEDRKNGMCRYRVVYFISAYPNGISHEVGALIGSSEQK